MRDDALSVRRRKSLRRRDFMQCSAGAAGTALIDQIPVHAMSDRTNDDRSEPSEAITLFLCGDVMLGRGIDQILAHPGDPRLYEPAVGSATTYVELAEGGRSRERWVLPTISTSLATRPVAAGHPE
jgi:hypothetical protein